MMPTPSSPKGVASSLGAPDKAGVSLNHFSQSQEMDYRYFHNHCPFLGPVVLTRESLTSPVKALLTSTVLMSTVLAVAAGGVWLPPKLGGLLPPAWKSESEHSQHTHIT